MLKSVVSLCFYLQKNIHCANNRKDFDTIYKWNQTNLTPSQPPTTWKFVLLLESCLEASAPCCIFWPAIGCCAFQMLVKICIFNFLMLKTHLKSSTKSNIPWPTLGPFRDIYECPLYGKLCHLGSLLSIESF